MTINFNWLSFLGVILIVFKILGYIKWSWWLVTLPIWLPWTIAAIFGCGTLTVAALIAIFGSKK